MNLYNLFANLENLNIKTCRALKEIGITRRQFNYWRVMLEGEDGNPYRRRVFNGYSLIGFLYLKARCKTVEGKELMTIRGAIMAYNWIKTKLQEHLLNSTFFDQRLLPTKPLWLIDWGKDFEPDLISFPIDEERYEEKVKLVGSTPAVLLSLNTMIEKAIEICKNAYGE
jgi:hypothetical protein